MGIVIRTYTCVFLKMFVSPGNNCGQITPHDLLTSHCSQALLDKTARIAAKRCSHCSQALLDKRRHDATRAAPATRHVRMPLLRAQGNCDSLSQSVKTSRASKELMIVGPVGWQHCGEGQTRPWGASLASSANSSSNRGSP